MAVPMRERSIWTDRWAILRRRRALAVWVALATLAVVEAFILGLPQLYRAEATLVAEGFSDIVVQSTPAQTNARLQVIKQQALSRRKLQELVRQFDLYPDSGGPDAIDRMERDIAVRVTSSEPTGSGGPATLAFTLSYIGETPWTAADVTNALASFYVAQNDQMRVDEAAAAVEVLSRQADELRSRLESHEGRIRGYTNRNIGALPQQIDANIAAVNRLDAQIRMNGEEQMRLLERRQSLENQLAEIDSRRPDVDETRPEARLERLRQQLVDLRTRVSDDYPDVRAARAEIAALERQIAESRSPAAAMTSSPREAVERALEETRGELARLTRERAQLGEQLSSYQSRVDRAPAHEPVFAGMLRDYQATRDQYDALQRRLTEAELAARAGRSGATRQFRVLDAALPPAHPTGPSRVGLLALGVVLSIALGLGVAVLRDRLDSSFRSLEELRAFTSVPVLASIPEVEKSAAPLRQRVWTFALTGARLVALAVLAAGAYRLAHASDTVVRVLSRVG